VLDEGDWRHRNGAFAEGTFERNLDLVDALKEIATDADSKPPHLAIRWLLSQPVVGSVIAGAKSPEQLSDNAAAGRVELTVDLVDRINALR